MLAPRSWRRLVVVTAAQGTATLTNDDVVKMVRAQLAPGIIVTTIDSSSAKFDVSPAGLIALKDAGVPDNLIQAMQERVRKAAQGTSTDSATRTAPEKSELLVNSKDPVIVLRHFKTMLVDASKAAYFGTAQMKRRSASTRVCKGTGPFSGPAGATSVAAELVKALKPYRIPAASPKG